MPAQSSFPEFAAKMRAAGLSEPTINAFGKSYNDLLSERPSLVWMPENRVEPVMDLPRLDALTSYDSDPKLLSQTVMLKLNGGLGTSMGLDGPKSLVRLKDDLTFLDVIVRQVLHLRKKGGVPLRLLLMNSFSTGAQTREFLRKYPELGEPTEIELMQSMVPKVDATTYRPVQWPQDPKLEWCPPGHGDLYPSLAGSGWLKRLLNQDVKYLFISNSDNLGATLDDHLLSYFAKSGLAFLMEVAERTPADRKGGHLTLYRGKLRLRERAQCPEADLSAFEDVGKHCFFNTNNLWIRLEELDKLLQYYDGFIPLPVIRNKKPIDPRRKDSPRVFQLETAMGAAIECFDKAGAVVVPRARFAPVKTTNDLLALRSDCYVLTEDWQMVLAPSRNGMPPTIDLDGEHYRLVDQLDEHLPQGVPSLLHCQELMVRGRVTFNRNINFGGKVVVLNPTNDARLLLEGNYADREISL